MCETNCRSTHCSLLGNVRSDIEGRKLFEELKNLNNIKYNGQKYIRDLAQYEKICGIYNDIPFEPFIKFRLANYFRGEYYQFNDQLIQAEQAYLQALAAYAPEETKKVITDAKIKAELLNIYYCQENFELAIPLLQELITVIENNDIQHGLRRGDIYRIYIIRNYVYECNMDEMDIDNLNKVLSNLYLDIKSNKLDLFEASETLAILAFTSIILLSGSRFVSENDRKLYLKIIEQIDSNKTFFILSGHTRILMYQALIELTKDSDLQQEKYITECLKLAEKMEMPMGSWVEILQPTVSFCYRTGRADIGEAYLHEVLELLTAIWHSALKDINDKRLSGVLGPTQLQFSRCYAIIRKYLDIYFAYEKVLQFKELASLAIKERNRIYRVSQLNGRSKFQMEHNRMAGNEISSIIHGRPIQYTNDPIYSKKLIADAEFNEQFPDNNTFTEITWKRLRKAVPDNSSVIEYFYCENTNENDECKTDSSETTIDIYITCKKNGCCTLNREVIRNGKSVLQDAKAFIELLQQESGPGHGINLKEKEKLRNILYQKLIMPILGYLQEVDQLFFAPDKDLINLPFGILSGWEDDLLENEYNIIQIECARDFLFHSVSSSFPTKSLIIGNPQYKVTEQDFEPTETGKFNGSRDMYMAETFLEQIPFSKVEVQLVSKYCGSRCYFGSNASKDLLILASGYKNIHIATHGYFDLSNKSEALYSSCLFFAGAENWIQTGNISKKYGNGIVTADEISRLDMHSVELVVISSCWGSMNRVIENKGFHGLIGGFSAAGVRYVISNFWETDDLACVILMSYFYYQYIERNQPPDIALKRAKQYLSRVTIGQLKQNGFFKYMLEQDIDSESKELIRQYRRYDDWKCPFKDEIYWGGFVCCQCN